MEGQTGLCSTILAHRQESRVISTRVGDLDLWLPCGLFYNLRSTRLRRGDSQSLGATLLLAPAKVASLSSRSSRPHPSKNLLDV